MTTATHPMLVDVGEGRVLCATVRGDDGPVIALLGGGGGEGVGVFKTIEATLAEQATVVAHDRAGTGRSDDGPPPRSMVQQAADLRALLVALDLGDRPVVVSGWSLGGLCALRYALDFPDTLAAIVLLDPTPTDPPPDSAKALQNPRKTALLSKLMSLPWQRLPVIGPFMVDKMARAQAPSEDLVPTFKRLLSDPRTIRTMLYAMARSDEDAAAIKADLVARGLPDVPVRVISAGDRGEITSRGMRDYEQMGNANHEWLASLTSDGKRIVAEGATHNLPADAPDLILEVFDDVLSRLS